MGPLLTVLPSRLRAHTGSGVRRVRVGTDRRLFEAFSPNSSWKPPRSLETRRRSRKKKNINVAPARGEFCGEQNLLSSLPTKPPSNFRMAPDMERTTMFDTGAVCAEMVRELGLDKHGHIEGWASERIDRLPSNKSFHRLVSSQ